MSRPLFPPKIVAARFADVLAEAKEFANGYSEPGRFKIHIDELVLICVIQSTYDDIARYKLYHLEKPKEEKSDAVKRSAYLTKWLIKHRPFYVIHETPDIEDDGLSLLANETFAMLFSLAHLFTEKAQRKRALKEKTFYDFLYDFHFRDITADALLAVFKLLNDQILSGVQFES